MITNNDISSLYKKFKNRPTSSDDLNFSLLFEGAHPDHAIEICDDQLIINSIPADSPFHSLPTSGIHAIVEFEEQIAIVMHASILFLNRSNKGASVHIKPIKPTLAQLLKKNK